MCSSFVEPGNSEVAHPYGASRAAMLEHRIMASTRVVTACLAGALVALAQRSASAMDRTPVLFPHGLHLQEGGRYVRDLCDPDARMRCHAHELMPADYRPGSAIHPYAGPPSGAMVPSDV